ncbi:MAG: FecR family protein [Pseudomonadota bacterium]
MGQGNSDGERPEGEFTHDDPVVDEALEWFARLRNVTPDPATRAAFERWLSQSPRHAQEYRDIEAMWGAPSFRKAVESLPVGDRLPRARRRSNGPAARWTMRVAAAAAVLLIAVGAWQYPTLILRWQADYLTATGDRTTVQLPDGSSMMLDTASAVSIDFKNGKRQVTLLEGEAFFDVRHDVDHPFRVTGHFGEVEVRGTAFAVRTDSEEDRVILERGRVNVSRLANPVDQVDLAPGQMVVATAATLSAVTSTDPETALAWRDGRIIFEDQPLSRVLNELRRYYTGTVIVADSRVSQLIVTGNYRLDDVEGAIRTLADAAGVTMNRLPGGIIILR